VPVNVGNSTYWKYEYSMKDHTSTHFGLLRLSSVQAAQCQSLSASLGNTRVVFAAHSHGQPELLQQTSYYPFGMTLQEQNFYSQTATENKYLYNSKELQDDQLAGNTLDWYDYGARFYDATLGRWHVVDPLAEKYQRLSPYVYTLNNPIRFVDPDGMRVSDPLVNPYIRAAVSNNVQKKVADGENIGRVASITAGVQVGGAKASVNFLGTKLEIGGTLGKVESANELNSTGMSQKMSITVAEGTANVDILGKIVAGLGLEAGKASGTISSNGEVKSNYTDYETSSNISKSDASINLTGDISVKVSAGNITAGASLNPMNLIKSIGEAISTFATYLNEVVVETMNPQRIVPEEIKYQ
jgi:RHS repeat-associated protein